MKRMLSVWGAPMLLFTGTLLGADPEQNPADLVQAVSDTAYQLELEAKPNAVQYYRKAIGLAQAHHLPRLEGQNLRYLGLWFQTQARYDSALLYLRRADPILARSQDTLEHAKLISDLGNLHNYLGDFSGAIAQYIKASGKFQQLELDSLNTVLFANIGYAFIELDNFSQAEFYNRQALQIARSYQMEANIGVALLNLGSSLKGLGKTDSAYWYFQGALVYGDKLENHSLKLRTIANLAGMEAEKKNFPEAVRLIRQALALSRTQEEKVAQEALLGRYLIHTGAYTQAQTYLKSSLEMARKIGLKEDVREAYQHLSELAQKRGNIQAANAYLQAYIALSDSLQNFAIHKQSQHLGILFETERKDRENQLLKTEYAEKALALQAAEARSQRNLLGFLLFASLFLGVGISFVLYRVTAGQKRKLAEQAAAMNRRELEQLRQRQQLTLMKAMLEGQEKERNRLAKDLHDGLGGLLSSVQLQFDQVQKGLPELDQHQDYKRASTLLRKAGSELRQIAHDLMPANLHKFGLITALEDFISEINYSKQLQVELQCYGLDRRLPEIFEISLYRIVQELIHNALKHAQAGEMLIQLFREGEALHLTVEDNGVGMEPNSLPDRAGHGLRNIQSRIDYLDGTWEINSSPGQGTSFIIELDLADYDTASHRG